MTDPRIDADAALLAAQTESPLWNLSDEARETLARALEGVAETLQQAAAYGRALEKELAALKSSHAWKVADLGALIVNEHRLYAEAHARAEAAEKALVEAQQVVRIEEEHCRVHRLENEELASKLTAAADRIAKMQHVISCTRITCDGSALPPRGEQ